MRPLTLECLTLGRTRKFIPPPWYKEWGLMEPLLRVFDMLQYFETILRSVESLWSSQQDELYLMGGGAARGLWRHQQWSSSWPPPWILPRIRNQVKTARNNNCLCLTCKQWCKITHELAICIMLSTIFTFIFERSWENMHFHPKMGWPPATYDVITRNHRNWPSLKVSQNVCKG